MGDAAIMACGKASPSRSGRRRAGLSKFYTSKARSFNCLSNSDELGDDASYLSKTMKRAREFHFSQASSDEASGYGVYGVEAPDSPQTTSPKRCRSITLERSMASARFGLSQLSAPGQLAAPSRSGGTMKGCGGPCDEDGLCAELMRSVAIEAQVTVPELDDCVETAVRSDTVQASADILDCSQVRGICGGGLTSDVDYYRSTQEDVLFNKGLGLSSPVSVFRSFDA